ncbi:MAG: class I SAM-dependent methyltransferase [Planctomycetaceae bacterium]|jgi:SAM-dependent methyltransferase
MAEHGRYVEYIHSQERQRLLSLVGKAAPRVLDVGCGVGRIALEIAPRCRELIGIDIAESLLERARTSARSSGITNVSFQNRGLDAPFGLGTFDLVVFSGVLNCLDDGDAESALRYCVDSLAVGGTLYIRNNCAVRQRIELPEDDEAPPFIHRTSQEYLAMVGGIPSLTLRREGYLFPPLCVPNIVYYHAIPKFLRNRQPVRSLLDAWFRLEALTAEARLRWLGPAYGAALLAIRKPTFFHVIEATRTADPAGESRLNGG